MVRETVDGKTSGPAILAESEIAKKKKDFLGFHIFYFLSDVATGHFWGVIGIQGT